MRGVKVAMAAALAAVFGSTAAMAEMKGTTLNYVGSWSGLVLYKQLEKPFWSETLPADSKGKIKVEVSTFDRMGLKGAEVYRILAKNVFDIGATVADYTVQDAPELEGLDIPMLAMSAKAAELAELGVAPPSSVPLYYRVSVDRLSTASHFQVLGGDGSGEAEAVILGAAGRLWVGVGSDHTDRKVESCSVAVSKELCPKPISRMVWAFDEVAPHWDDLILRSFATIDGARVLYQEGKVASLLPPRQLIDGWVAKHGGFGDGQAMFCGTLPAMGGIRPSARFEIELEDPVLKRRLNHVYEVEVQPVVS